MCVNSGGLMAGCKSQWWGKHRHQPNNVLFVRQADMARFRTMLLWGRHRNDVDNPEWFIAWYKISGGSWYVLQAHRLLLNKLIQSTSLDIMQFLWWVSPVIYIPYDSQSCECAIPDTMIISLSNLLKFAKLPSSESICLFFSQLLVFLVWRINHIIYLLNIEMISPFFYLAKRQLQPSARALAFFTIGDHPWQCPSISFWVSLFSLCCISILLLSLAFGSRPSVDSAGYH